MIKLNLTTTLLVPVFMVVALLWAHGQYRGRAYNYLDQRAPIFEGQYSSGEVVSDGLITVASYNIRYGKKIPEAANDLQGSEPLHEADILLLQEMDEVGTKQLARLLCYNYIFIPATVHPRSGRNFGNAILSKWPIVEGNKLVLPHTSWWSGIHRTATKAKIKINHRTILVYSTHTEFFLSSKEHRQDQWKAILDDIDPDAEFVVVGGDFNTVGKNEIRNFDTQMTSYGLRRPQYERSSMSSMFMLRAMTDHLYVRGFSIVDSGIVTARKGSDHYPIWVRLTG